MVDTGCSTYISRFKSDFKYISDTLVIIHTAEEGEVAANGRLAYLHPNSLGIVEGVHMESLNADNPRIARLSVLTGAGFNITIW